MTFFASPLSRRVFLGAALSFVAVASVQAGDVTFQSGGAAIRGYDPVAYFIDKKPVKGDAAHSFTWDGATWRFASADNLATFKSDPARYAPKFGGYCAFAVSRGYTAPTDPEAWTIVDDALYLNYSKSVRTRWNEDRAENIKMGIENWPGLRAAL